MSNQSSFLRRMSAGAAAGLRPARGLCALALLLLLPAAAQAQVPDTLMAVRDSSGNTRMSLHRNGALLVGGNFDGNIFSGGIPQEGAGTRMMWYPEKAAFRAGYVNGTQWDDANIGYQSVAMGMGTRASGDYSAALGLYTWSGNIASFAMGENCAATGAASVALGYHAHTNARTGSFVFSDRSSVDTIRAAVNHSANWRVAGGFRIFTSSNLATGVTIQSGASVSNWNQSNAVISTSTGAYLSTAGVWTNTSDVHRKHLFEAISGEAILAKLRTMPISRWTYKTDNDSIRHIGPMAQDFYAAFRLGNSDRAIGTVDADGVALAGVQALDARTTTMRTQIDRLQAENAALRGRLDALEKRGRDNQAGLPLLAVLGAGGLLAGLMLRRRNAAARS